MTVKELRAQTGLSQGRFAAHFQIPARTLQQWEQGIQNPPPYLVAMMERILELEKGCEICNKPAKWLAVFGTSFPFLPVCKVFFEEGQIKAKTCPFCGQKLLDDTEGV